MPDRKSILSAHPSVKIEITRFHKDFWVRYEGPEADLIAAGVLNAFMLNIVATQKGGRRRDAQRRPFRFIRYPASCVVHREPKTAEEALSYPGVRELYPDGLSLKEPEPQTLADRFARSVTDGMVAYMHTRRDVLDAGVREKERAVGRLQRVAKWAANDGVVYPDWVGVQAWVVVNRARAVQP